MHENISEDIGGVLRIEPKDKPRNAPRMIVEVATLNGSGSSAEGHRIKPPKRAEGPTEDANGIPLSPTERLLASLDAPTELDPTLIEIYADRLPDVLARTRTDEHRRVWETACTMHEGQLKAWMEDNAKRLAHMPPKERRAFVHMNFNGHPVIHLRVLGYKTGLPPLEYTKVVHPVTGERIDAAAWQALSPAERSEWMLRPPATTENANDRLAEVLARVLGPLTQQQEPRGKRA